MNALVAIRANATGLFSPTPAQRRAVADQLKAAPKVLAQSSPAQAQKVGEEVNTENDRLAVPELDRDAFLQLLVIQLQNQDPLEPADNQQMLAQLAQFSALEQMNNLNESFELLSGNFDQLNFISASELLGRRVSGVDLNGVPRQGVVESVHLDGSLVVLSVDGELMSMAGIIDIDSPPTGEEGQTEP
jgi:flagellar basal-body rod modification protein FlgD